MRLPAWVLYNGGVMFWRQPMAHFYAEHYGGYLYIWLEGGNHAFSFVNGFRMLVAKRRVEVAQ